MKKLYTLALAAFGFAAISFGQYDVEVNLVNPASGSSTTTSTISYSITNNGPDALPTGDTIFVAVIHSQNNFSLDGTAGSVSLLTIPQDIPAGTTLNSADIGANATVDLTSVTGQVCMFATIGQQGFTSQAGDPNDSDMDNNADCFTNDASSASVENVELAEMVKVFSTDNSIEIAAEMNETLNYNVYNMTGQSVASGDFNSFVSVPTSGMNNGIYIVNVSNGTEVKTIKVAVNK